MSIRHMNKEQLREYIQNFNDFTNINSKEYRKFLSILLLMNINFQENSELYTLARKKGIIN